MDVLIQTLMYVEVSNIMECNQHIPGAAFKSLSQIPANQTFKVSYELNSYEPNFYVIVQKSPWIRKSSSMEKRTHVSDSGKLQAPEVVVEVFCQQVPSFSCVFPCDSCACRTACVGFVC